MPSLAAWADKTLPFPAREIAYAGGPDTNGASNAPMCAICYDELREPYLDPATIDMSVPSPLFWKTRPGQRAPQWLADPLWELRCGHTFHEACCAEWFGASVEQKRCPYCNQDARVV